MQLLLVWMIVFFYIYIQEDLAFLYFADIAFFTVRGLWQPSVEKDYWH